MSTQVKERPVLFSSPMIQAILTNRKTQTRRPVKPQPPASIDSLHGGKLRSRAPYELSNDNDDPCGFGFQDDQGNYWIPPLGTIGDRLWVRETWRVDGIARGMALRFGDCKTTREGMSYRADMEGDRSCDDCDWMPSAWMPRWASRINLEITGVRVERVQEITEEDAMKEGCEEASLEHVEDCEDADCALAGGPHDCCGYLVSAKLRFKDLWQSTHNNWDANPWVWVYEFKRINP